MIDRGPRPTSGRAAIAVALVTAAGLALHGGLALALGISGAVVLAVGVGRGMPGAVTIGATGLVAGVFAAGIAGASTPAVLAGTAAAVIAWEAGWTAIALGRHVGKSTPGRGPEVRRLGVTAGVGALAGGAGYAVFTPATSGQPVAAVAALLVAVMLLLFALD